MGIWKYNYAARVWYLHVWHEWYFFTLCTLNWYNDKSKCYRSDYIYIYIYIYRYIDNNLVLNQNYHMDSNVSNEVLISFLTFVSLVKLLLFLFCLCPVHPCPHFLLLCILVSASITNNDDSAVHIQLTKLSLFLSCSSSSCICLHNLETKIYVHRALPEV